LFARCGEIEFAQESKTERLIEIIVTGYVTRQSKLISPDGGSPLRSLTAEIGIANEPGLRCIHDQQVEKEREREREREKERGREPLGARRNKSARNNAG